MQKRAKISQRRGYERPASSYGWSLNCIPRSNYKSPYFFK